MSYNSIENRPIKVCVNVILLCFLILVFGFEKGKISNLLGRKCIVQLGNATFIMFMLHYPVRLYFNLFISESWGTGVLTLAAFFIIAFSIVVSKEIFEKQ